MRSKLVLLLVPILFCSLSFGKYSGGSGEPNDPYLIATPEDLNSIGLDSNDWDKHFLMTADINMSNFTGGQFNIIGNSYPHFKGVFDGNGHVIHSLTLSGTSGIGLFGEIIDGLVCNLGLEDVNIIGTGSHISGLCAYNFYATIDNCYVTGSVIGGSSSTIVGGICGYSSGTIVNVRSSAVVSGKTYVGGLCGINGRVAGRILNSYATGDVTGGDNSSRMGGLCGESIGFDNIISNCYATGAVIVRNESSSIGGLCGVNVYGTISDCYATGDVIGGDNSDRLGGLCGSNEGYSSFGLIENCYSIGEVTAGTGSDELGGLCGADNTNNINDCYFLDKAGPDNGIGQPLTDEQMKEITSYVGWDFSYTDGNDAVWFIPIEEYPILTWQISPADIHMDGKNNFRDFSVLSKYWMRKDCAIYNSYCDWADMDFDGVVDINDLYIMLDYWLEKGIY